MRSIDELRTLEGEAQVLGRAFPLCELLAGDVLERRQNAGEKDIHALHRVGKLQELLAPVVTATTPRKCKAHRSVNGGLWGERRSVLFGHLFDVVAGGGVVGQRDDSGEAVEEVANGDVDGLAKDAVPVAHI